MKPRSAVATYILAALDNASAASVHKHAERFKQKRPPLKSKEKARVEAILAFYRGKIADLLATTPFEGDFAEVPGIEPRPPVSASATDASASGAERTTADQPSTTQTEAARRIGDAVGVIFDGLGVPGPVTINVTVGDITIGDVTAGTD